MLERFRGYQKNVTIKRKLLFINMVLAILPVIIFGIFITNTYKNAVDARTKQSVDDSSILIADRITRVLKNAENGSNYLTVNINKVMAKQLASKEMTLSEQRAVTNELYVAKIVFDEISSIAYVNTCEQVLVSDNTILTNIEDVLDSRQLEELKKTNGKSIWFPLGAREFLVQDTTEPVLTLGKKVIQINTGKTMGYIFLNVDISAIQNHLSNQLIHYRLEDRDGNIISLGTSSKHLNNEDVKKLLEKGNDTYIEKYRGRKYYISNHEIGDYNWRLIGITDLDEFNVDSKKITSMVLAIAILVIALEMLLSNYLSKIITVPLQKLKSGADKIAGGNMDLRFRFKSRDEIGQLGSSFNYMAEQVQELLKKVDYEAKKKREYELALLHEQVKPHFLYNSLDITIKLSEMNRHKEARRAVRRLADYYRNSLSDSKEIITISKEIKIVEDYMELQQILYRDLFIYEIAIDEDVMNVRIPKLTLQPLIENSIYHGLKYKEETGIIRITGKTIDGDVILTVEDNGSGMSEGSIKKVLENNPEGHFGVYSVNHRIKLYYGEMYGIKIKSEIGEGTTIILLLPGDDDNRNEGI